MSQSSQPSSLNELFDMFESDFIDDQQDREAFKFDMYVKIQELRQISEGLKSIEKLPSADKYAWIEENEAYIMEMMESVLYDSVGIIDGIQLDTESMKLSIELVSTMRDTMTIVQNMLSRADSRI